MWVLLPFLAYPFLVSVLLQVLEEKRRVKADPKYQGFLFCEEDFYDEC